MTTEPPRRLAEKIARIYGAKPDWTWPLWLEWVQDNFATVKLRDLPGYEGVSMRTNARGYPAILIDPGVSGARQLFTLAHELGHVSMFWHAADVACAAPDITGESSRLDEREANAFAAELLAPAFWLEQLVAEHDLPDAIAMTYSLSSASATTLSLQLIRTLSAGWAFIQVDDDGIVQYTGRSDGTQAPLPSHATPVGSRRTPWGQSTCGRGGRRCAGRCSGCATPIAPRCQHRPRKNPA